MDVKSKISMKKVITEGETTHEYQFLADAGTPLGESYDFLHECLSKIVEMSQAAADRVKQKAPEVSVKEE